MNTHSTTNSPRTARRDAPTGPAIPPLRLLYLLGPLSPRGWMERVLGGPSVADTTEATTISAGLEDLRNTNFDVVLIDLDASERPIAEILTALRSGTHEHLPIVVLASGDDRRSATECLRAGANRFLSLSLTTSDEFIWHLRAAAVHGQQMIELQRLRAWQQRHGQRQQAEIVRMLDEQAALFANNDAGEAMTSTTRQRLTDDCRELLQAFIVMGRGHLDDEVARFTIVTRNRDIDLTQLLSCYHAAVKQLVNDRGERSARHIYDRGNLLLTDLLVRWNTTVTPELPR